MFEQWNETTRQWQAVTDEEAHASVNEHGDIFGELLIQMLINEPGEIATTDDGGWMRWSAPAEEVQP